MVFIRIDLPLTGKKTQMTVWSISNEERLGMVSRMADNIGRVGFFRGTPLAEDLCQKLAASIEKRSYAYAQAQSKTTTGKQESAAIHPVCAIQGPIVLAPPFTAAVRVCGPSLSRFEKNRYPIMFLFGSTMPTRTVNPCALRQRG